MKIRALFLIFASFHITSLIGVSVVTHHEYQETERFRDVPLSWRQAAQSWRMTIDQYIEEADKIIDNTFDGSATIERSYEDLVPIFNPYINLNARAEAMLKRSFSTEEDYKKALVELEKKHPKFTVAK
jgi:hypothetical protein